MDEQQRNRSEAAALTFLRERDLAARWHKSIRTLQRWRKEGYGPAYLQIGGTCLYRLGDILDYEAAMCRGGNVK